MMRVLTMTKSIGETVKELRERRGWTMGQLAAYADVSTGYVSKLEAGKVLAPASDVLQRLAGALRVDVGGLLGATPPASDPLDLLRQALVGLEAKKGMDAVAVDDPELVALLQDMRAAGLSPEKLDAVKRAWRQALDEQRGS
jgi:transcriptional regulator with XRE-family HTH domain